MDATQLTNKEKKMYEKRLRSLQHEEILISKDEASRHSSSFIPKPQRKKKLAHYKKPFLLSVILSVIFYIIEPTDFVLKFLMIAVGMFILGTLIEKRRVRVRRSKIEEDLPSSLDLLVVCVEAGLSISAALARVAGESAKGPLAQEFRATFNELNLGVSFEESFYRLADRCGVPDVKALTTAIIQSEKLGISLGETLRNHSQILRETIRFRTREKVMKLPVQLLFPIAVFIFPAIFVVILGPAGIQMSESFGDDLTQSSSANDDY